MNWDQALEKMRAGHPVNRRSQLWARQSDLKQGGTPVIETGTEACCLMHAWTHDNKPVQVFVGAKSKCLFVPDSDLLNATDWQVV